MKPKLTHLFVSIILIGLTNLNGSFVFGQESVESPFKDLPITHPYFNSVLSLYDKGVLEGYTDGTFRPEQLVSRAEFVKLVLSSTCLDCARPPEELLKQFWEKPFPDVDKAGWYFYCVSEGKIRKIIEGYTGGKERGFFLPERQISRAEAVAIILRASGLKITVSDQKPLDDVIPEAWYKDYLQKAVELDLIKYNRGLVKPEEEINRGEAAFMANRILEIKQCKFEDDYDKDGIINRKDNCPYVANTDQKDTNQNGYGDACEPTQIDSDQDGLNDQFEKDHQLNPYDAKDAVMDSDQDNLNNLAEFQAQTNPQNADTDGDGIKDGAEVEFGLNPLDASDAKEDRDNDGLTNEMEINQTNQLRDDSEADSDQDKLTNREEFLSKTDPRNPDTDEDGLEDGWEIENGTNPLERNDARADFDYDGYSNLEEALAETDLFDSSDHPQEEEKTPPESQFESFSVSDEEFKITSPVCNSCPCYQVDYKAQLHEGDTVMSTLYDTKTDTIYSRSEIKPVGK